MISIDQTRTTPAYSDAGAAVFDFGGTGYYTGSFVVMNAAAYLSLRTGVGQGTADWQPEFPVGPSSLTISGGGPTSRRPHGSALIFGIRCRTFAAGNPWNAGTNYAAGDVVTRAGVTYVAVAASLNQQPPNAAYWSVADATVFGSFWQPGEATIASQAFAGQISSGGVVTPPSLLTTDGVISVSPTRTLFIGANIVLTQPSANEARLDAAPSAVVSTTDGVITVNPTTTLEIAPELQLTQPVAGTARVALPRKILACWAGAIPSATGPGLTWPVPYNSDGSSYTFTLTRAVARIETTYTSSIQIAIESSPGVGAFTPSTITTLTIAAGSYQVTNAGLAAVVSSGDLLRVNFAAVGAPATTKFDVEIVGTT